MSDTIKECRSCGDAFSVQARKIAMREEGIGIAVGEFHYCRECADELFRGTIRNSRAKLDSSALGCPLEPSDDDASPWQENARRAMEGD
jgi:hypothetical protein